MLAQIEVQDSDKGILYDLSQVVTNAAWETTLIEQPGKLTFEMINDDKTAFSNGSRVRVKMNGENVFFGYVFTQKLTNSKRISITAYDGIRSLQNKDILLATNMTSSEIFVKVCKEQGLEHKVISPSSYKIPPTVFDNKSYYEMINTALEQTLTNTGKWYIIRDNFGVIEHIDLAELRTDLFIGDECLLTGYDYEKSIDSDTFDQIKLSKDNKETKKREIYIAKDSDNIKKWGRLQYFETMDEQASPAQIIEKANMLLKLKNRQTRSLSITCLGDLRIQAGNGLLLGIKDLANHDLPSNYYGLVSSCNHKFKNHMHTMDLKLEMV